jgi:hypothetical protein
VNQNELIEALAKYDDLKKQYEEETGIVTFADYKKAQPTFSEWLEGRLKQQGAVNIYVNATDVQSMTAEQFGRFFTEGLKKGLTYKRLAKEEDK